MVSSDIFDMNFERLTPEEKLNICKYVLVFMFITLRIKTELHKYTKVFHKILYVIAILV